MTTDFSLNHQFSSTNCFFVLFWYSERFIYTTCSELGTFMFWTGNSMNNLLSYCGLVEIKISASEKDLPVHIWLFWPLFGQLLSKLCKKGHLNAAWQAVIGHFQIDWIDIRHNSAGAYFWLNFSLDLSK